MQSVCRQKNTKESVIAMTKLEKLRKKKGLKQTDLATEAKIAASTYSMYERGKRRIPKQIAENIAKILECEVFEIFAPADFIVCDE